MINQGFDETSYLRENPDVAVAVKNRIFKSGFDHFRSFGLFEGRSVKKLEDLNRNQKALSLILKGGLGLEIGPSHNPIAPKSKGYSVHIVDHLDAAGLKKKYADHNINLDLIEDVDYVWDGKKSLAELIGAKSRYDYIIASHVIEHIPDLISFLQACEALLNENGVLSLVVPDKRYCFDYFNPVTNTGELLDAWINKSSKPSPGKIFDHISNASKRGGIAWDASNRDELSFVHTFFDAKIAFEKALESNEYVDVHLWRFTPASLRLIFADLSGLGLIGLYPALEFDTEGCEFFVSLTKTSFPSKNRLDLMNDRAGD